VLGFLVFALTLPSPVRAAAAAKKPKAKAAPSRTAPASPTPATSGEVRDYVVSINRLYENLEYERALQQIERAKRLAQGAEDEVVLSLYEGIILSEMGRKDEATAAFKSALFLRPDAKLPVKVAPKLETNFESVRRTVKKQMGPMLAQREAERRAAEAAPPQPEPQAPQAKVTPPPSEVAPPVAASPLAPTPSTAEVSPSGGLRSKAYLPAIAGGVLVVAGGVSYGLARAEHSRLLDGDPDLRTPEDVRGSVSRGKTLQAVGFGLMGVGVVGLGVSAGMYLLGAPEKPLALGVSTDGTSAFVYGRWP
jgi:tetratricopeptide (TPR) repeat protein